MKSALRGVPAFVLITVLSLGLPCLGQDGPLLPGLEPGDPASPPTAIDDAAGPPSPVEIPLPIDDSITPLDENGQPMNGPEADGPLRLPAPPPLPVTPHTPSGIDSVPHGPSLPAAEQSPSGKSAGDQLELEPQKRNLWQRSTDALRDITQPKAKKETAAEQDAARHWQMIRQRELEQQQREQRQLQQRQLQQRALQQRELQRRQFEQRQQHKSVPSQGGSDPRAQGFQAKPGQRPMPAPSVENRAKTPAAAPQTSSRRQPQRFSSPQSNYPAGGQAVPPSARGRKPLQPREAKNDPRSPWERS